MNQFERLLQLHKLLSTDSFLSLQALAKAMSCSPPTVLRTLNALQSAHNKSIEHSDAGWRYALETERQFELPGMWLEADEFTALVSLEQSLLGVEALGNDAETAAMRRQFDKLLQRRGLAGKELSSKVRCVESPVALTPPKVFEGVSEALILQQQMQLSYLSLEKKRTQHIVSPLCLVNDAQQWTLHAWCHHREQLMSFNVARIVTTELRRQKVRQVAKTKIEQHINAQHLLVRTGQGLQTARLRFSPEMAREAASLTWHSAQFCRWQGGDCTLTIAFDHVEALVAKLLPFVPYVTVEAPAVLQKSLLNTLKSAIDRQSLR